MDIAVIPAYNPDEKLIDIVTKLREYDIGGIIVVNDGSRAETLKIFKQIKWQATVLTHEINRGKGTAIKTALSFIEDEVPEAGGIVLLDADGQHKPEDAFRLLAELHKKQGGLIIGARKFKGKIPLRSRFGNTITKYVFRLCSGKWVSDTQTGLRAFPRDMIPDESRAFGGSGDSGESTASGTSKGLGESAASGTTEGSGESAASGTSSGTSTGSASSSASDDTGLISELETKFADHFTHEVVSTGNSYSSKDISIMVDKYTEGSGSELVTYYVADIYTSNIKSIQSGFADDTYGVGYTESILDMDEAFDSLLTMNGDYYGNGGNGIVIRNGEVYRSSTDGSDVCVLYYDGIMETFSGEEFDADQAIADGAWQAWSFGPALLNENGSSETNFSADSHIRQTNPRSAIGYYEPGHYCLVVVDGRQNGYSAGMTLAGLSQLFEKLGCRAAYNLDGGKSSVMTFNDALVNEPVGGGRGVSDCIMIKEVDKK